MKRPGKIRDIVFRTLAGIVSAMAAVALVRSLLGGPSGFVAALVVIVGGIGIFVAFASYAAFGESSAYKVLEAFGVARPPELHADNESAPMDLSDDVDQSNLPEPGKPEP